MAFDMDFKCIVSNIKHIPMHDLKRWFDTFKVKREFQQIALAKYPQISLLTSTREHFLNIIKLKISIRVEFTLNTITAQSNIFSSQIVRN